MKASLLDRNYPEIDLLKMKISHPFQELGKEFQVEMAASAPDQEKLYTFKGQNNDNYDWSLGKEA